MYRSDINECIVILSLFSYTFLEHSITFFSYRLYTLSVMDYQMSNAFMFSVLAVSSFSDFKSFLFTQIIT